MHKYKGDDRGSGIQTEKCILSQKENDLTNTYCKFYFILFLLSHHYQYSMINVVFQIIYVKISSSC